MTPLLPENAPFNAEQRAWLSGFFAALIGSPEAMAVLPTDGPEALETPLDRSRPPAAGLGVDATVAATWHDPALALAARMERAEGLALPHRLYAAMGQQDCGQCGYLCQSYARALFDGSEQDATLCTPGGRETRRKLKELLAERDPVPGADEIATPSRSSTSPGAPARAGMSRQHPLPARLIEATPLHANGSERDTRHVAFELPADAPAYAPGDALGVLPRNDPVLVQGLLARLDLTAETILASVDPEASAFDLLSVQLDITRPSDECLELLGSLATDPVERELLMHWIEEGPEEGTDLLEVLERCPGLRPDPVRLLGSLSRLQPRLYSIASSPDARPGVVDLTVGIVRYERGGRVRHGVATGCLADAITGTTELPIYLQPSAHFHLPTDPATPIIMVGPGTGIAPFRGFLQTRARVPEALRGPSWLFFGNPHAATDFLYRQEIEGWLADGTLSRLSTAFSRDQAEKIYVQQRMREEAALLWQWLHEDGACFYVCGDARRMAGDVQAALLHIAEHAGGLEPASARRWLDRLTSDGRYLRDVY